MKMLDIAFKDLLRSLRSFVAVIFMFVLPLLTTGVIFFAFSGLGSEDDDLRIPVTKVQVVNLDNPGEAFGGFSAGEFLLEILQSENLAGLIEVTVTTQEADARTAVENGEAGVAMIIPEGFSQAAFSDGGEASILLYEDPTLTIGPSIVRGLVTQLVDGFSGMRISTGVIETQLENNGVPVNQAILQQAIQEYTTRVQALGAEAQEGLAAVQVQPITSEAKPEDFTTRLMGSVMVGMMIFYAYFTGANVAQSIIQEDEDGTLARLFTTPTPQATILGGKFISIFLTLAVQILVLMGLSTLLFGLQWGAFLPVVLAILALIVASAGFGLLLMSFVKTTQQAGPMLGGVVTMFGMAGGLMTTGFADMMPEAFNKLTLFTPQGWTLRTWQMVMTGSTLGDVLLPAGVTIGLGVGMFFVGMKFFRKRFA